MGKQNKTSLMGWLIALIVLTVLFGCTTLAITHNTLFAIPAGIAFIIVLACGP